MAWRPEDLPEFEQPYDPVRYPSLTPETFRRAQRWYFAIILPGLQQQIEDIFDGVEVTWPDEESQS